MTAEEPPDWIERVVGVAKKLGMNPVRVRWKLQRFVNKRREAARRREQRVDHIRYEHKTCPQCTAVNDRAEKVCTRCGAPMHSRPRQVLGRLGLHMPRVASTSMLLGLAITVVYARMLVAADGKGLLGFPMSTLIEFGGRLPAGVDDGEWWRPATAVFLHQGILHLGFNLISLAIVGPQIEDLYGKWRVPFLFMLTGVLANLVSGLTSDGVGIGASGAIMGLVGVAAGWGHRRRDTPRGRNVRNDMLKWAAYTVLFGFYVHADNIAHVAGFVAGGLIGLVVDPAWLRRGPARAIAAALAILGGLAAAATLYATLVPISGNPWAEWDEDRVHRSAIAADIHAAFGDGIATLRDDTPSDVETLAHETTIPSELLAALADEAELPLYRFIFDRKDGQEGSLPGASAQFPETASQRCPRAFAVHRKLAERFHAAGVYLTVLSTTGTEREQGCDLVAVAKGAFEPSAAEEDPSHR